MINETNTIKTKCLYCKGKGKKTKGICLNCDGFGYYYITKEQTAEDLINETETEPFTPQEKADLNLSKCVRALK